MLAALLRTVYHPGRVMSHHHSREKSAAMDSYASGLTVASQVLSSLKPPPLYPPKTSFPRLEDIRRATDWLSSAYDRGG